MLKEVNIARMSEHVSELKRRVENYLAEHRHDNHEPHEEEPHSHDEKWIPGTVWNSEELWVGQNIAKMR